MKFFPVIALILYSLGFVAVAAHFVTKKPYFSRKILPALMAVGILCHTIFLAARTLESSRLPVASVEETLLFYSWSVAVITLLVIVRYAEIYTPLITLPFSIVPLFISASNMPDVRPLPLVLQTYWFEIHVIASFAAYALFTLAFAAAIFYLFGVWGIKQGRSKNGSKNGSQEGGQTQSESSGGLLSNKQNDFQDITARAVLWGFFFFSVSMFAGAVWGYLAWGAYWMWEPKILWSFIVWFWYAGTLHVWYVRNWKGSGLSVAALLGLFVVGFTYLGVGLLMKSSHSF